MAAQVSPRMAIVVLVAALIGASLVFALAPPTSGFQGHLRLAGGGDLTFVGSDQPFPFVNLTLTFTFPATLDAAGLAFYLVATGPNRSLVPDQGLASATLRFAPGSYPGWALHLPGPVISTDIFGMVTEPNGSHLGGILGTSWGSSGELGPSTPILSGATVTVVFSSTTGRVPCDITATYQGSAPTPPVHVG